MEPTKSVNAEVQYLGHTIVIQDCGASGYAVTVFDYNGDVIDMRGEDVFDSFDDAMVESKKFIDDAIDEFPTAPHCTTCGRRVFLNDALANQLLDNPDQEELLKELAHALGVGIVEVKNWEDVKNKFTIFKKLSHE